jgi:hypothetical protein
MPIGGRRTPITGRAGRRPPSPLRARSLISCGFLPEGFRTPAAGVRGTVRERPASQTRHNNGHPVAPDSPILHSQRSRSPFSLLKPAMWEQRTCMSANYNWKERRKC